MSIKTGYFGGGPYFLNSTNIYICNTYLRFKEIKSGSFKSSNAT